jgi:hypothetical protein
MILTPTYKFFPRLGAHPRSKCNFLKCQMGPELGDWKTCYPIKHSAGSSFQCGVLFSFLSTKLNSSCSAYELEKGLLFSLESYYLSLRNEIMPVQGITLAGNFTNALFLTLSQKKEKRKNAPLNTCSQYIYTLSPQPSYVLSKILIWLFYPFG